MRTYTKRLLTVLLVLAMLVSIIAVPGMAAETYVAKIGDVGYSTFSEALTAAKAMTGDVTVEIYDKVTLDTSLSGSFDSIKFVGKDTDSEIYLEVQGYITASSKKVAFEDLILSKSTGGFINNAGFMNVAFGVYEVTEVTYTNCTFANGAYASSGKVTYTGCTFKRSNDKYGLWAYGNVDVTVDSCTFADYRGIKMYAENQAKTTILTVKNSDFSALDNKPAIVLTYGKSVTLENNTYSSTGVFELDLDGDPNGVAVTSDVAPSCMNDNGACGVLVDGKIYTTVAQAAEAATAGSTVTLLHDSTETVELEGISLVKNGYAASGVTVKNPVATVNGDSYANLPAAIAAANGQTVELLADVTIDSTINIEKDMIIDGNDHSVTFTCHTGFYPSAVNFTLQNITLINNGMPHSGATHPQYVDTRSAANITFDNVTAKAGTQYAVNMRGASSGASLTIKNSTIDAGISGSNTINVWGNNHKIEIINSSLSGRAMYGYHFAVIAFNSDGSNTSNGNSLTIDNSSTLTCTAESGQNGICYPIHIPTSNSNGVSVSIASGATINTMDDSEDIIVKNAVVSVGNKYFNNQADAFTAAKSGDTVTLLKDTTVDPSEYLAEGLCFKTVDNQYFIGTHELVGVENETGHWSECLHCGDKTEEVAHTYTLEDVVEAHLKSAATCTSPAVYYKSCSGCGYPSSSDADTFTYGTALVHELTPVAAKAATCTENGVNAHYTCSGCGKLFNDPDGKSEITKQQATVLAKGHKAVMGVEGKLPTCTTPGNIEYVECSCGALFTDAECKNEITLADTVVAATGHKLTKVAAKAATCTTAGNTEYYSCANCNALFADAEGKTATTAEKVVVAATGHKLTKVEAVAPTYTAGGNIEHYACACGALFADAEGKTATTAEAVKLAQLIEIKESTAEVSSDAVDTAIKEAETTGSITIDLVEVAEEEAAKPESGSGSTTPDSGSDTTTKPAPVVSSAALPVKSLEKVAEISEEATLTVNMTEVTVTIDAKAMAAVAEQSAAETVTLKVEKVEAETLTEEQQAVIEDKEVAVVVTATMISNNTAISDFKGGSVTIAIPFALPEGTEGSDFQVYYVADDGTMTAHDTEYKNGCLVFSTTHFSDYVVVNTAAPADPTVPNTGDTADLMLYTTALMIALTGLAVLFIGKKKFSF